MAIARVRSSWSGSVRSEHLSERQREAEERRQAQRSAQRGVRFGSMEANHRTLMVDYHMSIYRRSCQEAGINNTDTGIGSGAGQHINGGAGRAAIYPSPNLHPSAMDRLPPANCLQAQARKKEPIAVEKSCLDLFGRPAGAINQTYSDYHGYAAPSDAGFQQPRGCRTYWCSTRGVGP